MKVNGTRERRLKDGLAYILSQTAYNPKEAKELRKILGGNLFQELLDSIARS